MAPADPQPSIEMSLDNIDGKRVATNCILSNWRPKVCGPPVSQVEKRDPRISDSGCYQIAPTLYAYLSRLM